MKKKFSVSSFSTSARILFFLFSFIPKSNKSLNENTSTEGFLLYVSLLTVILSPL